MLDITKSIELFNEAKTLLPGGVDSPVRAFKGSVANKRADFLVGRLK